MTNDVNMDEICKGCLSYERIGTKVANSGLIHGTCLGYMLGDVNCPCQHCLIKPMCNRVCKAFTETTWYGKTKEVIMKK